MHTSSEVILGIDPGTRITGFGIIQFLSTPQVIDYGCIRPPSNLPLEKKYLIIFNDIEKLIKKYRPSAIAVETQYVKKNVQSAIKLGMARGAVVLAAAKNDIPVYEYAPTQAKLSVVGKGQASKHQVTQMITRILQLPSPPKPEDAADALAIALCHSHHSKKRMLKGNY